MKDRCTSRITVEYLFRLLSPRNLFYIGCHVLCDLPDGPMHNLTDQTLKTARRETRTTKSVLGSRCHPKRERLRSVFPQVAHALDVLQSRDFRHSVVLQERRMMIVPKGRRQDRSVLLEALLSTLLGIIRCLRQRRERHRH